MERQQLIEWLRKEGYRMPVIMMSALGRLPTPSPR
jgi:DNA-binding response OmpR family regulator